MTDQKSEKDQTIQSYLNNCAVLGEKVFKTFQINQEISKLMPKIEELAKKMAELEKKGEVKSEQI